MKTAFISLLALSLIATVATAQDNTQTEAGIILLEDCACNDSATRSRGGLEGLDPSREADLYVPRQDNKANPSQQQDTTA